MNKHRKYAGQTFRLHELAICFCVALRFTTLTPNLALTFWLCRRKPFHRYCTCLYVYRACITILKKCPSLEHSPFTCITAWFYIVLIYRTYTSISLSLQLTFFVQLNTTHIYTQYLWILLPPSTLARYSRYRNDSKSRRNYIRYSYSISNHVRYSILFRYSNRTRYLSHSCTLFAFLKFEVFFTFRVKFAFPVNILM